MIMSNPDFGWIMASSGLEEIVIISKVNYDHSKIAFIIFISLKNKCPIY